MVNVACGIARGRVMTPTTVVVVAAATSRKHGDLSHGFLVNMRSYKGSHQLNDIGYSFQLTAVKKKPRWPVSHDHITGSDIVWGCLSHNRVAKDGAQRKYTGKLGSTYACSLYLLYLWEVPFIINWQLSKQGICWPVSRDRIVGSRVELTEVTCFLKVYRWPTY